jgi:Predicted endonuclease distantly related to archaeal Holliday junction resolvase
LLFGSGQSGLSPSAPHRQRAARNARSVGSKTERRARWHYRLRGYRILGSNVWIAGNELDLIVRRGQNLAFVEVKGKGGTGFGDPLEMVTAEKMRRLRRAAVAWLASNPSHGGCDVRFDVVAERAGKLERVANAF